MGEGRRIAIIWTHCFYEHSPIKWHPGIHLTIKHMHRDTPVAPTPPTAPCILPSDILLISSARCAAADCVLVAACVIGRGVPGEERGEVVRVFCMQQLLGN